MAKPKRAVVYSFFCVISIILAIGMVIIGIVYFPLVTKPKQDDTNDRADIPLPSTTGKMLTRNGTRYEAYQSVCEGEGKNTEDLKEFKYECRALLFRLIVPACAIVLGILQIVASSLHIACCKRNRLFYTITHGILGLLWFAGFVMNLFTSPEPKGDGVSKCESGKYYSNEIPIWGQVTTGALFVIAAYDLVTALLIFLMVCCNVLNKCCEDDDPQKTQVVVVQAQPNNVNSGHSMMNSRGTLQASGDSIHQ